MGAMNDVAADPNFGLSAMLTQLPRVYCALCGRVAKVTDAGNATECFDGHKVTIWGYETGQSKPTPETVKPETWRDRSPLL